VASLQSCYTEKSETKNRERNVSQACCSIPSSESFNADPRSLFPKQVIYDCIFTENNIKFMESKVERTTFSAYEFVCLRTRGMHPHA